ncbi:MAG: PadR family transcriptional regulator [Vicinamibacterales bacterium]
MASSLGEFELVLLLAVVRLNDSAYGVTIRRAIEESTGRNVSAGAVYTALGRLEMRGLVTSTPGETVPERTGMRRRYYRVRPEGARHVQRAMRHVETMARGVMTQVVRLAAQRAKGE